MLNFKETVEHFVFLYKQLRTEGKSVVIFNQIVTPIINRFSDEEQSKIEKLFLMKIAMWTCK